MALSNEAREQIMGIFNQGLDQRIDQLASAQKTAMGQKTDRIKELLAGGAGGRDKAVEEPGIILARLCLAAAAHKNNPGVSRAEYLKEQWPSFALAIGTDTVAGGGAAVRPEFAADFIEPLRQSAVVRQLNPVQLQSTAGTITIPKLVTGSTLRWIGENQAITSSTPVFGDVQATSKTCAVLVPISKDFLNRSVAGADQMVRDDMLAATAEGQDSAFISGTGSQWTPMGLVNMAGIETFAMTASPTLQLVTNDLWKPIMLMKQNKVPFRRPGYIISPVVEKYLMTAMTANGVFTFRDEMLQRGTINGYPYRCTTLIADSIVLFADFGHVVIVDELGMEVSESAEASYHNGSSVISSFETNQVLVRLVAKTDIIVRHPKAVCTITGVTWGS